MIHHEERYTPSPENIPNVTNPLTSNIEAGHNTLNFKESISQPVRLDLMEATRKDIVAHEDNQNWTLGSRRYLNVENTIMSICYFIRKRDPYGRLVKQKYCLCDLVGMQQWGVSYWYTYYLQW